MPFKPPDYNLTSDVYNGDVNGNPSGPPRLAAVRCAGRSPRQRETFPLFQATAEEAILVLAFPPGTQLNDQFSVGFATGPPPADIIVLHSDPNVHWRVLLVRKEARGYANEHVNAYCDRLTSSNV